MKLKSVISRGQARTLEDALAACKADHQDGMPSTAADELGSLLLAHSDYLRSWTKDAWKLLFANLLADPQADGKSLQKSLIRAIEFGAEIGSCVMLADQSCAARLDQLRAATQQLEHLSADLEARWPWIDEDQARKGLADYEAGRFRPVQEIFDELRRPGSAVH